MLMTVLSSQKRGPMTTSMTRPLLGHSCKGGTLTAPRPGGKRPVARGPPACLRAG